MSSTSYTARPLCRALLLPPNTQGILRELSRELRCAETADLIEHSGCVERGHRFAQRHTAFASQHALGAEARRNIEPHDTIIACVFEFHAAVHESRHGGLLNGAARLRDQLFVERQSAQLFFELQKVAQCRDKASRMSGWSLYAVRHSRSVITCSCALSRRSGNPSIR